MAYDPALDNTPMGNNWNGSAWVNPQGQVAQFVNGQWVWPQQQQAAPQFKPPVFAGAGGNYSAPAPTGQPAGNYGSSYSPQAGYGWQLQQMQGQQGTQLQNLQNQGSLATQQAANQGQYNTQTLKGQQDLQQLTLKGQQDLALQTLQGQQAAELERLKQAANAQLAQKDYDLKIQLQNNEITQAKYDLEKRMAQQESEFARNLAQQQLEFGHKQQMDQLNAKIAEGGEMRAERELQAKLAANPQDWVAYEFYKRSLGQPSEIGPGGSNVSFRAAGADGATDPNNPTMMDGTTYEKAPGAYTDATAQGLATALFNPTVSKDGYNPGIKGTGVFGTQIEAPNTLTRGEVGSMSSNEMGMLSGLLKAGVTGADGKRIAIDPTDYFQQSQNSWVPTLAEGTGDATRYS